jgi:outer membrane protein assembly factor BamB
MPAEGSDGGWFWPVGVTLALLCGTGCRPTLDSPGQESSSPPTGLTAPSGPEPTAAQLGSTPDQPTLSGSKAGDAWPLFRGDPQATGVARSGLPEKLEVLWTFSVDGGGFQSTAAIAEGMVYAGCLDGKLYAVDLAKGQKQWEFPTELGFTASAAVRNGLVFIGDSDGRFYCIDAKSGKARWHFDTEAEINSSANFYKDNVLFGSQDGKLYCLKADSGQKVWQYESENMIQCSPTVADDRAFVAGCDAKLHVIDLAGGQSVSEVDIGGPTLCTPAVAGGMVFVGNVESTFFGINWQGPAVVWRYRSSKRSTEFRSSAAVCSEVVIVGARDRLVHAVDRNSGQGVWTFPTKAAVDSSPVVVGSRVFVGSDDGRLYALDRNTGRQVWLYDAGGSIVASPAVAAGRLVIGTDDGHLYCFGARR